MSSFAALIMPVLQGLLTQFVQAFAIPGQTENEGEQLRLLDEIFAKGENVLKQTRSRIADRREALAEHRSEGTDMLNDIINIVDRNVGEE